MMDILIILKYQTSARNYSSISFRSVTLDDNDYHKMAVNIVTVKKRCGVNCARRKPADGKTIAFAPLRSRRLKARYPQRDVVTCRALLRAAERQKTAEF
ncbi:hypothetical protein RvY_01684 [Ramazzottius varieornatus]|uniref:Uncharacterized protein n=1 Tax=Ramazzottius varieornatus TaxID=947166 RepID=A0A1D1UKL6_RAMVA|nr:hypothetical protein RvY_01684 [Ramazzottius varieornatus]